MHKKTEKGSAIVLVLWILAILLIISLSFSFLIHSRIKRTEMLFARFNAYIEAYSTVQYGINIFLTGKTRISEILSSDYDLFPDGNRYFLDGSSVSIPLFNKKTKISFQDNSGLINLRLYNPELVDGILKYFGMEEENRRIFIDSLRDWIDEDNLVRLNGAEKEYYEKLGYQPRNSPLLTLDEITLIKGMENSIYSKIKAFLFLGKSEGLNLNVAPFEVLMSLPNMTEEGAKRIILYRKNMYIGAVTSLSSISGIDFFLYARLFSFTLGHNLLLKATSELGEKNEYTIHCHLIKKFGPSQKIIDFSSEIKADEVERWNPFEILYWKEQIK